MPLTAEVCTLADSQTTTPVQPLPRSTQPITRPFYGHASTVESGFLEDDFDDDEDAEYDEEEYIEIVDDTDFEYDEELYYDDLGVMWVSNPDNRLAGPYAMADSRTVSVDPNDERLSLLGLPLSLPYEVETLAEMDARLEFIICRLTECVKGRDWVISFKFWSGELGAWQSLGYPMRRDLKIRLIFLYYEILFVPGLKAGFVDARASELISWLNDRNLTVNDLRIPWRPLYEALYNELFPHPSKLARNAVNLAPAYLNVAESAQRFFHPAETDEMLATILPRFNPAMDSILATQTFLVHFLPIASCDKWMPLLFRMWYGLNSGLWDDQASDILGQLAMTHIEPRRSDPVFHARIPRANTNTPEEDAENPSLRKRQRSHRARTLEAQGDVEEDADGLTFWVDPEKLPEDDEDEDPNYARLRRDVGIFTDGQFAFIMTKCLRSLNVPVGGSMASQNSMSITHADTRVSKKILDSKKPIDRTQSLAEVIIYSISEDAPVTPFGTTGAPTRAATPAFTPHHPASADPISRVRNGDVAMSRTDSTDSLKAAGESIERSKKYLAGSKALDHLSRLITSCETFFHPSNAGHWSSFLTVFLSHLTSNFVQRWKMEEEPGCKVPAEWRLTPEIKRSFVLTLRPVALTAMFNKDMESSQPAISTLKRLALLEPDLIMPAIMERAIPSLQGLEETQRTASVTFALAAVAQPLSGRKVWRFGGMYVADILTLLLPGIDLNDPTKTGLSCMAICNMVDQIRIADISDNEVPANGDDGRNLRRVARIKVDDDPNDPVGEEFENMTDDEIESRLRMSTGAFRDWVHEFLGRVLLLIGNLPEEGGKTGRAGGRTEVVTLQSVLHTCGAIFGVLDDKLFDAALDQVAEYATTTTKSNAVDAVGELVKNLTAVNAKKTFAKFFPICRQRIASELRAGASSVRTTTTSIPRPSDAPLHWWMSILYGLLVPGRLDLAEHRKEYMELLRTMLEHTYSERGWAWAGNIIEKTLSCVSALYLKEMKFLNPTDWASEDFKQHHTMWWGKLIKPTDTKPQWRTPTEADVEMAMEVVGLAEDAVSKLEGLLDNSERDFVWKNDFCRAMNVVDEVLLGSYSLIGGYDKFKTGGTYPERFEPEEVQEPYMWPRFKAGFVLTDPEDPRYQRVLKFRKRTADMLHRAAATLRTAGDDNSVDVVKLLVSTMGSYLFSYGMRGKKYSTANSAYENLQASKRTYEGQRKAHRSVYLGLVQVTQSNRLMWAAYHRPRSAQDDDLIKDLVEFGLSPFVRVRRRAQHLLTSTGTTYYHARSLFLEPVLEALKPGTDPDRMKGALYILRSGILQYSRVNHEWQGMSRVVEALLGAHHETKASIQTLVNKNIDDLARGIHEAVAFPLKYRCEKVDKAADDLAALLTTFKPDQQLIDRIADGVERRIKSRDQEHEVTLELILSKAKDPSLSWRYQIAASRFLYVITRRDRPTDPRVMEHFLLCCQSTHPRLRDYGHWGLTRLVFDAMQRTFTKGSLERLLLQEPGDPLRSTLDISKEGPGFTERYFKSFLEEPTEETILQDRVDTGWLVWGRDMEVHRFAKWDEQILNLDEACKPGMNLLFEACAKDEWWEKLSSHLCQEENRNYPSASHIDLILALSQIMGVSILDKVKPVVQKLMADIEEKSVYDRHQTRALMEFIAGTLRGHVDWPGKDRKQFWDWITPLLPELFRNIRQDALRCWEITMDYVLHQQDPRRHKPLVDFMVSTALATDWEGSSAYELNRRTQLPRILVRCLKWRFTDYAPAFEKHYFNAFNCTYADVRGAIGSMMNALDQLHWAAAYPNVPALLDAVHGDPKNEVDIMGILPPRALQPQLDEVMAKLEKFRVDRPSGPKAALSDHDTTATTTIHWLATELVDVHAVGTMPYIVPILPKIFECREMNDNTTMQNIAGRLLAMITAITPAFQLVEPLMEQLISILHDSTSWRTKIHCMPVLSLTYFRNMSLLSEPLKAKCLDVISACLKDENQEVREMASVTLSGFLRCSQRSMVLVLKDRFVRDMQRIKLPRRTLSPGVINPKYQSMLVELHAAVLGAVAIVEAFPYTVPKFIPSLLADTLAPRVSEPMPISASIRACIASFKRTHEKYQERMTEDQIASMNYAQAGNSYYA